MKGKFKKPIIVLVLATIFLSVSIFAAQQVKVLKASNTPPKEAQEIENMAKEKKQEPIAKRRSVQELGRGKMLKASKTPPREALEIENMMREKPVEPRGQRPSVTELKDKLKNMPDQKQKLEMINRGQRPVSSLLKESISSLAWLNPLAATEAWAGTVSLTLDYTNGFYYGNCWAAFFRGYISYGIYNRNYPIIYSYDGYPSYNSYICMRVYAPSDDWYLINVENGYGRAARLETSVGEIIETWPTGTRDCLTAQYLAAGYHYFYYKVHDSLQERIFRITIDSWN